MEVHLEGWRWASVRRRRDSPACVCHTVPMSSPTSRTVHQFSPLATLSRSRRGRRSRRASCVEGLGQTLAPTAYTGGIDGEAANLERTKRLLMEKAASFHGIATRPCQTILGIQSGQIWRESKSVPLLDRSARSEGPRSGHWRLSPPSFGLPVTLRARAVVDHGEDQVLGEEELRRAFTGQTPNTGGS